MGVTAAEAARLFRESLEPLGEVRTFRIDGLDRTGIVTVQANLVLGDEPAADAYGYGFAEDEAAAGALGELAEEGHMQAFCRRAPRTLGSYAHLVRERGERGVCDPRTVMLPAGCAWTPDTPMVWIEARRWGSEEPVLVPQEWVAAYHHHLPPGTETLITPITNGLGAGFDLPHAIAHGIMELTQRDGNVLSFRALDRGVVVDTAGADEEVSALLAKLRALGIRPLVKCASTSLGLANIYVVGDEANPRFPIQVTACGEASHPSRAKALRKALLEFCGSRQRKAASHGPIEALRGTFGADFLDQELSVVNLGEEEPRALAAMAEWVSLDAAELRRRLADTVLSERRRIPFARLPEVEPEAIADGAARLSLLAERLAREGMEILYLDTSPSGSPVRTVKVIVPGLECETMSYHRIGWRGVRRLRARGDALILDAPREGAKRVVLRPEDEERAGGPAWFDAALADRIVGGLYPLYREPSPFAAQLAARQRAAAE
jgi:ribosomal protein S12 methylthiotransferase accessory factor